MTAMREATQWLKAGEWPEGEVAGTVTLSYADRCRRRIQMADDSGTPFLLSLQRAVRLSDGDGLALEQGGFLRVVAGPEPLIEAKARNAQHLAKLAWHIGNRHVPAEIVDGFHLRIVVDSVLEAMLQQLGAETRRIEAPFAPEGGAYAQLGINGHAH
jgi:urease accessory protein